MSRESNTTTTDIIAFDEMPMSMLESDENEERERSFRAILSSSLLIVDDEHFNALRKVMDNINSAYAELSASMRCRWAIITIERDCEKWDSWITKFGFSRLFARI